MTAASPFWGEANTAAAQPKDSLALFSGTARFEIQYDGITGKNQNRPKWIRTLSVNPSVLLFGFSIDVPLTVSTLESGARQPFNRFRLNYKTNWFGIQLFDAYPTFSPFSLNGLLVRGGAVDLHPGALRLKGTAGQTRKGVVPALGASPSFSQNLYAAQLGVGRENGKFFGNLSYLFGKDNFNSRFVSKTEVAPGDSVELFKPRENMVLSVSGGLNLFQNAFSFRGEIAGSGLARDSRSPKENREGVPSFLGPRISSQYDLSYSASARYSKNSARAGVSFRQVGASFVSFGVPYLLNDLRDLGLDLSQGFYNGRLFVDFRGSRSQDNLADLKAFTTTTSSFAPNIALNLVNLPYLHLGYSGFLQENDAQNDTVKFDARTNMYNLNTGYSFRFLETTHSPGAALSIHSYRDKSPLAGGAANFDAKTFMFSTAHGFKIPLAFSWGLTLIQNRYAQQPASDIWLYTGRLSPRFLQGKLTPSLNFSLSTENGSAVNKRKTRFGLSGGYRVSQIADLAFTAETIKFKDKAKQGENYDETLIRFSSNFKW